MTRFALLLASAAALAACSSQEDQLENSIRNELSSRGEVKQVEMTRQDADHMTGFAEIRTRDGNEGRLTCTATHDPAKAAGHYDWRCVPAIDERVVSGMESTIREQLARQAEVLELDMTRQDDSRMTGFARLRDANGNEIRTNCTATRESEASNNFNWQCSPGEAAPADGGDGGDK